MARNTNGISVGRTREIRDSNNEMYNGLESRRTVLTHEPISLEPARRSDNGKKSDGDGIIKVGPLFQVFLIFPKILILGQPRKGKFSVYIAQDGIFKCSFTFKKLRRKYLFGMQPM